MDTLITELDPQGILSITLNRPDKLNALSEQVLEELSKNFEQAGEDSQVKGLLISGAGKAFCAGADINQLAECDAATGYRFALEGQRVFRLLETIGKPSIAAVNGYAFGGGCELAIACSLRTASTAAQFGQPEVKLGVIPGYGGTQRLARLIGKGRALDLCLSGRFIDAESAMQWGLITHLFSPDELIEKSRSVLTGIIGMAPLALQSVLESIDHGYDMSLQDALHLEAVHFAKTCATADKAEGVAAFLAKRKAEFKGA